MQFLIRNCHAQPTEVGPVATCLMAFVLQSLWPCCTRCYSPCWAQRRMISPSRLVADPDPGRLNSTPALVPGSSGNNPALACQVDLLRDSAQQSLNLNNIQIALLTGHIKAFRTRLLRERRRMRIQSKLSSMLQKNPCLAILQMTATHRPQCHLVSRLVGRTIIWYCK